MVYADFVQLSLAGKAMVIQHADKKKVKLF